VGKLLDTSIQEMQKIEEPSAAERAKDKLNDDGRDDGDLKKDLASGAALIRQRRPVRRRSH